MKRITYTVNHKRKKEGRRKEEGKKKKEEMFYLTTHSTHLIHGYMASGMFHYTVLLHYVNVK